MQKDAAKRLFSSTLRRLDSDFRSQNLNFFTENLRKQVHRRQLLHFSVLQSHITIQRLSLFFLIHFKFLLFHILSRFCRNEHSGIFMFLFFLQRFCFLCGFPAKFHLGIDQKLCLSCPASHRFHPAEEYGPFTLSRNSRSRTCLISFLICFVLNRENDLHTAIQVTRHPVRTSHINLIACHHCGNRRYGCVPGNFLQWNVHGYSRSTPGIPTLRQQIPRTSRSICTPQAGCMIKSCNDLRITKGVHLGYDHGRHSLLSHVLFPSRSASGNDPSSRSVPQISRFQLFGSEYPESILNTAVASSPIAFITGKNTTVCIKLCCRIIIVTGCQMHISADSCLLH